MIDMTDARSRQAELVNSDILITPVTLIGCGAIGSFTALTLAKMGFHTLTVYDPDSVNVENISNQFYRYSDIGEHKALALRNMVMDFEGVEIDKHVQRWTRSNRLTGVVIMAVDSMTVRHQIFDHLRDNSSVPLFIDGRMGGQQAEVYAMRNDRMDRDVYRRYLWAEEEASELPCTQKAVMYNVLWIASTIANVLRLMLEGKPHQPITYMDFENMNQIHIQS